MPIPDALFHWAAVEGLACIDSLELDLFKCADQVRRVMEGDAW
jgi:hypothetical protein